MLKKNLKKTILQKAPQGTFALGSCLYMLKTRMMPSHFFKKTPYSRKFGNNDFEVQSDAFLRV